jgi:predicted ferric reductase
MNKNQWMKGVNVLLLVSFLVQVVTSLWLLFGGSDAAYDIHKYNGLLFILFACMHIFLNWGWIRSVLLKKRQEPRG